jgi:hypothetical protein
MKRLMLLFILLVFVVPVIGVQAQFAGTDVVVCEPQGGANPTHPNVYWYDVTPGSAGRCDFHVRVFDTDSTHYTAVSKPAPSWQFAVHKVGSEWWASWWDPGCTNAIFTTFRFQFTNTSPSTWSQWKTSISGTSNPYSQTADSTGAHVGDTDGFGRRVHVPISDIPTLSEWGVIILCMLMIATAVVIFKKRRTSES